MIYRSEVPIQKWGHQERSRKKLGSFGPCHLRGLLEGLQRCNWVGRQDGDSEVVSSLGPDSPVTGDQERGPRTEKYSPSEEVGDRRAFRTEGEGGQQRQNSRATVEVGTKEAIRC